MRLPFPHPFFRPVCERPRWYRVHHGCPPLRWTMADLENPAPRHSRQRAQGYARRSRAPASRGEINRIGPEALGNQEMNRSFSRARGMEVPSLPSQVVVAVRSRDSGAVVDDPSTALRLECYRALAVADPYSLLYEIERYRGTFEVVYLLRRKGSVTMYELRQQLKPSERAIHHALRFLLSAGLVSIERQLKWPFSTRYSLTERGQKFAETFFDSWPRIFGGWV